MNKKDQNQGFETIIALARLSKNKRFRYDYTTSFDREIRRNRINAILLSSLIAVLLVFVIVLPAYENHGITWEFPWVNYQPVDYNGAFTEPVTNYWVSDEFGVRRHPIFHYNAMHNGIDLAAFKGTPVLASGDGRITCAEWKPGYGNVIVLDHGNDLTTVYAHMSEILVETGDVAMKDQQIGAVGASGRATGNHLHFEVREDGKPSNPREFLDFIDTLAVSKDLAASNR